MCALLQNCFPQSHKIYRSCHLDSQIQTPGISSMANTSSSRRLCGGNGLGIQGALGPRAQLRGSSGQEPTGPRPSEACPAQPPSPARTELQEVHSALPSELNCVPQKVTWQSSAPVPEMVTLSGSWVFGA
jgi:hypothetical protein